MKLLHCGKFLLSNEQENGSQEEKKHLRCQTLLLLLIIMNSVNKCFLNVYSDVFLVSPKPDSAPTAFTLPSLSRSSGTLVSPGFKAVEKEGQLPPG